MLLGCVHKFLCGEVIFCMERFPRKEASLRKAVSRAAFSQKNLYREEISQSSYMKSFLFEIELKNKSFSEKSWLKRIFEVELSEKFPGGRFQPGWNCLFYLLNKKQVFFNESKERH